MFRRRYRARFRRSWRGILGVVALIAGLIVVAAGAWIDQGLRDSGLASNRIASLLIGTIIMSLGYGISMEWTPIDPGG